MEYLETSAKTVEEAIQQALEQLGVTREEVKVTILNEGKAGILGMGAEEAKIRVEPLAPTPAGESNAAEIAKSVLERLLSAMGITATVQPLEKSFIETGDEATNPVAFDIRGEDLGILIGRHGQTLASLQYIVRLIVSQQTKTWTPVMIDVEGYRQRRYQALQAFARYTAEQVKTKGTPSTLEPMSAYERRIIHLALADHPDVTTESTGLGETRRVVIMPKEQ